MEFPTLVDIDNGHWVDFVQLSDALRKDVKLALAMPEEVTPKDWETLLSHVFAAYERQEQVTSRIGRYLHMQRKANKLWRDLFGSSSQLKLLKEREDVR